MFDTRSSCLFAGLLAALIGLAAHAQPGPRGGPGPAGPQAGASAPAPGTGPGARGMMRGRWGSSYTPGWALMTPQERDDHRKRMAEARTPEECRALIDEHRKLMDERRKERGQAAMRGPRGNACGAWNAATPKRSS